MSRNSGCAGLVGPRGVLTCARPPSVNRSCRSLNFGTPRRGTSLKRSGPLCHCRLTAAEVAAPSDEVWRQLLINGGRLISRVRRVTFRIRVLNLSTAFGTMRRSLLSLEMLNPRNLGSSGRATALIVSLTHGFGLSCGASLALTECAAREYERRSSQCKDQESTEHISCSPKIVDEPSCVPRNRS